MEEKYDYDKLRMDILKKMIDGRDIPCKQNREDIVKHLKLDDEEKYIRETIYEKHEGGKFIVGIDIKNTNHHKQIGKLIESGSAHRMNMYSMERIYYITTQKLI